MKKFILSAPALMLSAAAFATELPAELPVTGIFEENTDSIENVLNPVVVTGTSVHQRLKDTPVPVQVITARELEASGINGMQEALTMMVPSLSFSPNAMGSYLRMNGLSNSHVLVLVNGRKLIGDISGNVDLDQIDMNLVERIEVLNGASSTLYGSDAVGGVINIILKNPSDEAKFNTQTRYTRKNQFDESLNLSLRAGKVGSLTSYKYSHSDGWQNSNLTLDGDNLVPTLAQLSLGYTSNNFSQRFTYDPTERLSLYAEGTYYRRILDRPVTNPDIQGGTNYNTLSESFSWGAGGKYSLGTLGHIDLDYAGRRYGQWYKYMVATGDFLPGDYYKTKRQVYHDAQATAFLNFSASSNTLFGARYVNDFLDRPESNLEKSLGTFSVFAQHEQRFLKSFTAIAGLRFDNYQEIGSRVTPKVALKYSIGDFNIRATYAMGYRAPGIDELYYHMFKPMGSRHIITFGNRNLKAEDSNYASINFEYRTARFSVSATGYLNFIKNMVTSKSTKFLDLTPEAQADLIKEFPQINEVKQSTLTVKEYYNFEEARVKGLEVNISGNPLLGLTLSANYSLAYGKGLNADETWQRLNRSVMHTGTVTANYVKTWDFYRLNVNLNGRVQSKTYYPGDADGDAPGYGIWNLTTLHRFTCFRSYDLEAGLGIDNIFNRRDNRPLNSNFALYSPGRSLVVSLAINIK